jgi:hypothetical protein
MSIFEATTIIGVGGRRAEGKYFYRPHSIRKEHQKQKRKKTAMRKKEVVERLNRFEDKYFDLVWLARKSDKSYRENAAVRSHVDRIFAAFACEASALVEDESNWTHGFNSGCLATARFVLSLLGTNEEAMTAEEEFPFLDT